jgi:hypothetical protein
MSLVAQTNPKVAMKELSSPVLQEYGDHAFFDNNSTVENEAECFKKVAATDISALESNDMNCNTINATFWDLLITFYFPIMVLWFRRSIFGSANLMRTIIIGHLFRLVYFENFSDWVVAKAPSWLLVLLYSGAETGAAGPLCSSKFAAVVVDPHAWPPPALIALALLSILTLVVHPDGLTWIVLGKLRYVNRGSPAPRFFSFRSFTYSF